mmetsp:Transcript_36759/g.72331  ORF Transcript_36759/g.72331 Transcript_36759/m.72331 type:complete len:80 (+) Transcript_36759:557-796(+)
MPAHEEIQQSRGDSTRMCAFFYLQPFLPNTSQAGSLFACCRTSTLSDGAQVSSYQGRVDAAKIFPRSSFKGNRELDTSR